LYVLCPTDLLHPTPYPHFKGFQSCDVLLSHSPYFCTVQGHTSNQCFHHSFLEASSFFSILPLVIPIRLLFQGRQSWWLRVATPDFGQGVAGRVAEGSLESWTGRQIIFIISSHVQEVCSKVVTLEEK